MGILSNNDNRALGNQSPISKSTNGILSRNDTRSQANIISLKSSRSVGKFDTINALNNIVQSGDIDASNQAIRQALQSGVITREQHNKYLVDLNKKVQEQGAKAVQESTSLGAIAGEVGKNITEFGKGVVSSVQQGAGAVFDIGLQAVTSIRDVQRNLDLGKSKEQKDVERLIDVNTAEGYRKWLQQQKDVSGENIAGTSGADIAANRIRLGQGTPDDYLKVGLTGLNVGANAMTLANPIAGATKSFGGTVAKNALNNAIIGAVGGGAQAGANDQNILGGALQGAVAGAVLSGGGSLIGKARSGSKLTQALDTVKVGDDIAESVKVKGVDTPQVTKTVTPQATGVEVPVKTSVGEQKVAGSALKTQTGIGQELGGKATYTVDSYKANKISMDDLARNNKNEALKIVNNTADSTPAQMQEAYKALDKIAKETGDVDLAQQLASSKAPTALSEAAQALGQRGYDLDPTSPTDAIRSIRNEAAKKIKERTKDTLEVATAKETKKITSQIKVPTKQDWASFIEELRCK